MCWNGIVFAVRRKSRDININRYHSVDHSLRSTNRRPVVKGQLGSLLIRYGWESRTVVVVVTALRYRTCWLASVRCSRPLGSSGLDNGTRWARLLTRSLRERRWRVFSLCMSANRPTVTSTAPVVTGNKSQKWKGNGRIRVALEMLSLCGRYNLSAKL